MSDPSMADDATAEPSPPDVPKKLEPKYAGEWRSAIARAKRILLAAGFAWSRTTGRYHPFASEQKTTPGIRVTRIGYSNTVSVSAWGMHLRNDGSSRELEARALATLRAAGLPFDDRGWLECNWKGVTKP